MGNRQEQKFIEKQEEQKFIEICNQTGIKEIKELLLRK